MSRSNYHFLAILPLFAVLSLSPMELETKVSNRSIASIIGANPKLVERSAKIDKSKIEIDQDLDINCFSEQLTSLVARVGKERKDYQVDLIENDQRKIQKARIESLVFGMVSLEKNLEALKEKEILNKTTDATFKSFITTTKSTIEELLQDEVANDLAFVTEELKVKDEAAVLAAAVAAAEAAKVEVKAEAKPVVETAEDDRICDLQDKNLALTKQVEELIASQKLLTDNLNRMSGMMMQQQSYFPNWMMSGSMMNPQMQYPTLPANGQNGAWVYYPQSFVPQLAQSFQQQQQPLQPQNQNPTVLGQQTWDGAGVNQYQQASPAMQDLRYSLPQDHTPMNFGLDPFMHGFGDTIFNQPPVQTA